MALLDNLDLSHFLAPAGYTPSVADIASGAGLPGATPTPPPVTAAGLSAPFSGMAPAAPSGPAGALQNLQIGPSPGGPPQSAPPPDQGDQSDQGQGAQQPGGLQGLLAHLTATDPQTGLTFRDKLMALGSIMQGKSGEGQQYLENQQAKVMNQRAVALKQQIAQQQASAFAQSFNPDGTFDQGKYARLAGGAFDPDELAKLSGAVAPQWESVITREGDIGRMNKRTGQLQIIQKAAPKAPGPLMEDPANPGQFVPNPAYAQAMANVQGSIAQAKAPYARPAKGPAAKAPKSYSSTDVQWH